MASPKQPTAAERPTSRGRKLDLDPAAFGHLPATSPHDQTIERLRERLESEGFLYLPEFFDRDAVQNVRAEVCQLMAARGMLDPSADPIDAIPHPNLVAGLNQKQGSTTDDFIGRHCESMHRLLYGESTSTFFARLLRGPVRHYELTWFRAVAPGFGTVPHCDIVYMGRGTHQLLTCWVPYDDISLEMGGLMLLEGSGSAAIRQRLARYLARDVDEYCSNRPLPKHVDLNSETDNKVWNGWLATNPASLRANLGGRWLTTDYRMGDALIFSCQIVHASLDNRSQRFRLSSDCRYQLASEPIDERFVGAGPYGHVGTAKRGRVC